MTPFAAYRMTSPYGWRMHPVYKERRFHTGVDLVTTPRGPIRAFMGGTVRFAGIGQTGGGFGNYGIVVAIEDHRGALHCYCHLSEVRCAVGDVVSQGAVIGLQGATGIGTGEHLHYEVRKRTAPQYGWEIAENRCYHPGDYLESFAGKEAVKVVTVKSKEGVVVGKGELKPDGVTWVPLRVVVEALGAGVEWDGKTMTATVITK